MNNSERMRDNFVKGFIEGYLKEKYRIAHNLLDVLDAETIVSVTGLSLEMVEKLRANTDLTDETSVKVCLFLLILKKFLIKGCTFAVSLT